MRRIYVLAVILLTALFCSSCIVEEANANDKVTRKGLVIYQYYQFNTFQILLNYADLGFKLNAWLALPDTARRDLEMKYFPSAKIYKDGEGIYGLYENAKLTYTINTNGRPLSDVNADWVITWEGELCRDYGYPSMQSFTKGMHELHIKHVAEPGRNAWHVTMADADSAHSYINLVVEPDMGGEYIAESLFEWGFSIMGSGCYLFTQDLWEDHQSLTYKTYLRFNIDEPMPWICNYDIVGNSDVYDTYHFRGGKAFLNAMNSRGDLVPVDAEFKGIYDIAITYKNVTEIWNVEEKSGVVY